jgi:hypothetical protein
MFKVLKFFSFLGEYEGVYCFVIRDFDNSFEKFYFNVKLFTRLFLGFSSFKVQPEDKKAGYIIRRENKDLKKIVIYCTNTDNHEIPVKVVRELYDWGLFELVTHHDDNFSCLGYCHLYTFLNLLFKGEWAKNLPLGMLRGGFVRINDSIVVFKYRGKFYAGFWAYRNSKICLLKPLFEIRVL